MFVAPIFHKRRFGGAGARRRLLGGFNPNLLQATYQSLVILNRSDSKLKKVKQIRRLMSRFGNVPQVGFMLEEINHYVDLVEKSGMDEYHLHAPEVERVCDIVLRYIYQQNTGDDLNLQLPFLRDYT